MLRRINSYFTTQEKALWLASVGAIVASFFLLEGKEYLTLTASLIGITSLLFNAKGNPVGQALTVVFSLIYGYISYACAYYGEMITYLGMTAPMALLALISWLRHPFQGNRAQVQVNKISRREHVFMWLLTAAVTAAFYFILKALGTANLLPSTVSVTTRQAASGSAAGNTAHSAFFRRSITRHTFSAVNTPRIPSGHAQPLSGGKPRSTCPQP